MDRLALKARTPPASPLASYSGVFCLNPNCGAPMDVIGVWPTLFGSHRKAVELRVIVTLECPHCTQSSTYCAKDVAEFQGRSRADWR